MQFHVRALGWQIGDVANGARAWALRGAEGLPDQVSGIGAITVLALGGLNKHNCYHITQFYDVSKKYFIYNTCYILWGKNGFYEGRPENSKGS